MLFWKSDYKKLQEFFFTNPYFKSSMKIIVKKANMDAQNPCFSKKSACMHLDIQIGSTSFVGSS